MYFATKPTFMLVPFRHSRGLPMVDQLPNLGRKRDVELMGMSSIDDLFAIFQKQLE